MAKIKIQGGTRSGASLCHSCTNGMVRKGSAFGQELVFCSVYGSGRGVVPHPIVECSEYYDKALPSIRALAEIATFINSDKKTGKIGFQHADKMSDDEKEEFWNIPNPFAT